MGILSVVNRNLVSNSKSQPLKNLSSNLWFIRRISNSSNTGLSKAHESHTPTADLKKSNNNKLMLLIKHFHKDSSVKSSRTISCSYSEISTENSWTDHHNFCVDFSEFGNSTLAGSCNELMLVFFSNSDSPFDEGYIKYLLWNRTTNKSTVLPLPGPTFNYAHGFGFDSESEDYKLIRFPVRFAENDVKLYSLKTNSWKDISYPGCTDHFQNPRVHVNGVYYWKAIYRPTSANVIRSFDFATEKFSSPPYIPLPPKIDGDFVDDSFDDHCAYYIEDRFVVDDFVLVENDGSLAALVHSKLSKHNISEEEEKPFGFEVWGWNGESWLEIKSRTTIAVPGGGVVKVVGLFENDKLFLQNGVGELLLFHLAENKLENVGIRAIRYGVEIFRMLGAPRSAPHN